MKDRIDTKHCLISIINNPKSYFDRCYLLTQIGNQELEHIILTNGRIDNNNTQHCTVQSTEKTLRANDFWSWSYQEVKEIMEKFPEKNFVIHEHGVGMVLLMLRIFLRKKTVKICSLYSGEFAFFYNRGWTIDPNGREFVSRKQKWKIIKSRFKPLLYRFASVFAANIIIGNSTEAANELNSIFRFKKRVVMNTCIIPERFAEKAKPKEQKNTKEGTRQLLYAGKIYPAKGIGTLLKSFALLQKENPGKFQLTIIGKIANNDRNWFTSILDNYGLQDKITIIPRVPQDELIYYYQHTDLFILPSFFEGSPRVMKEAMASGAAILCSNIAGTKVVDPKGEISFFFEPGNAEELKDRIQSICQERDTSEARRKKGQHFIQAFSVENLVKERVHFYKKIFKENER